MCGILASFTNLDNNIDTFNLALNKLSHRGPDDFGTKIIDTNNGRLILGHRRLSIIDLTSRGHQPMNSLDLRYTIVYNGEIYNYKEIRNELINSGHIFYTETDTEVLLTAWTKWNIDCIHKFNGMFSFAIYDHFENCITCVRDQFGIKPLFYYFDENTLIFSSEIDSITTIKPECNTIELQNSYDYLTWGGYDEKNTTFYKGIKQLKPAHYININLNNFKETICNWWRPNICENKQITFNEAKEELRTLFLENISYNLRSDVPVGITLSGGIDSSAIACAIRYLNPKAEINTFSYIAKNSVHSEEKWVDNINQHIGAIGHKIIIEPEDIITDLDDLINCQGEPFGSTSIYAQYRVYKLASENNIVVTLDGQGADELLAGYSGFPSYRVRSLIDKNDFLGAYKFLKNWSKWPGRSMNRGLQEVLYEILPTSLRTNLLQLTNNEFRLDWFNSKYFMNTNVDTIYGTRQINTKDIIERRLVNQLRRRLLGHGLNSLLRHGDRNSMKWTIEGRVPFLSPKIAEFVLQLPENFLISNFGETKYIFKEALRGIVPDMILDRRDKIGFVTPELTWLKKMDKKLIKYLDIAESIPFLNVDKCRSEFTSIINGEKKFSSESWRLINYCRWAQLKNIKF
jgi:asparagine synthase (glutamine-hydrolysing)